MNTDGTGERIGAYRVVRRIATGGTSDVLLAKAEGPHGFERTVVLKLLLSQFRQDEDFTRMFAREASAYARLSNPAIVQLHDFFSAKAPPRGPGGQEDQLVMVLEYVDGPTLYRLRGMLKTVGQALDDQASYFVAMRIYEALAAAHAALEDGSPAPVIHRDVNPANVLVSWDGEVKLADFGVAKVTGLTHQSVAGLIKGTYGYMAPEQVTGEPVTTRADVYGAAIILWELLSKRKAFQRGALPEVEVLRQMAEPRIPSLDAVRPDVDKTVRDALRTALAPETARRNISAQEMLVVLRGIVSPDIGRQRLQAALALVRHEPKTSGEMGAIASPAPVGTPTAPRVGPPRPNLSRPPAPPRAGAPAAKRKTMTYGATVPSTPMSPGTVPPNPMFDTLVEPPELVAVTGRPSERARMPSQIDSFTAGLNVGQAIDEILRGAPVSAASEDVVEQISARRRVDQDRETLAGELLPLPRPPPPLSATVPLGNVGPPGVVGAGREALAFGADGEDLPTVVPPLRGASPVLAPTPRGDFPMLDRTLAIEARPRSPSPPPYDAAKVPTAPPPPFLPSGALPTPVPPQPQASTIPPGMHEEGPRKKKSGVFVVLFVLLLVAIGSGLVGTMAYARWKKSRVSRASASASAGAPSARTSALPTSAAPSTSVVASASAASTAAASASAVASSVDAGGSGSGDAGGIALAGAKADAGTADAASTNVGDIPEGMGILRSANAPAGRRIFVDDKVVGQTPDSPAVKCGSHAVKIGSAGKPQTVDVPCGGEVTVSF